jgi:hypothetical protein
MINTPKLLFTGCKVICVALCMFLFMFVMKEVIEKFKKGTTTTVIQFRNEEAMVHNKHVSCYERLLLLITQNKSTKLCVLLSYHRDS